MLCAKCKRDNPADAQFCQGCGARLELNCSACSTANSLDANFCKKCGTRLTVNSRVPSERGLQAQRRDQSGASETAFRLVAPQSDVIDGERKTVTALFADIKGSTELMEGLDPEEARTIVDPALKIMIGAVRRYGGYVVQSTGDGIFVLFGAPVAHEDHPQRALYAALRMQEDLGRYSAKVVSEGGTPVQARIGINTGEVVVRTLDTGQGHAEYAPIGHSTNLAARMQTAAPVGSIAVTKDTRRLGEGYFTFKLLGPTLVKGVSEPINVWEVVGPEPRRTRLQRAASRGLTRFVGREREMEALRHAAELARASHGQIVTTMAEPGVGKSRLFHEFKLISQSEWMTLEAFSVSHGKASSYLPVIELLKDYFEIEPGDDERKRRERVNGKILTLDRSLEDTLPYLFTLLSLNSGEDPLAQMDTQIKRRRTHEAVKRILLRESLDRPLMLIFEDLHWIDGETQGLLNVLVDSIANTRILLLVNYRPEYRHEWGNRTYCLQLRLDPLGRESADEMLSSMLGNEDELAPLRRLISEKTEGNPFFIEEIVQELFEDGSLVRNGRLRLTRPLTQVRVPTTVQAVLASRIDRLPLEEKDLLHTLAVLGREFPLGLGQRVSQRPADELDRLLSRLQLAEFIYEQPAFPESEYVFKHALTQEVAYNSLLSERRKLLHEQAGMATEALYASQIDDHLSELARHYERSGNTVKAIQYLERAGHQAISHASQAEAITFFTSALELLQTMSESPERLKRELSLQLGLASAVQLVKGFSAAEVGLALEKAYKLCQRLDTTGELFETLVGLAVFYSIRVELSRAHELTQQLVEIAENAQDSGLLLKAHMLSGMVLSTMGEYVRARVHLERANSIDSPIRHSIYGPAGLSWLAITLGCLGYPDQALENSRRALVLAREVSDPLPYVNALNNAHHVRRNRREFEASLDLAEQEFRHASEHGFRQYSAFAMFNRGWALTQLDRSEEGIEQLREGLAAMRASGQPGFTVDYAALAEGFLKAGRASDGLAIVAEGLEASHRNHDGEQEAELWRIRGNLLPLEAKPGSENEAESCFRQAIEIAQHQQAKWWELRATVNLAGLLVKRGRRDEARTMLTDIYNWFTEGFDTADLKDAKALLDQLQTAQTPLRRADGL